MAKPRYRWPTIHPPSHPAGIKLNKWILYRDNYRCRINLPRCTLTATVADHINPDGAWFNPDNLRAACNNCNYDRRRHHTPTPPTRTPEHW